MSRDSVFEKAQAVKNKYRDFLMGIPGVQGVGVGGDNGNVRLRIYISSEKSGFVRAVLAYKIEGVKVEFVLFKSGVALNPMLCLDCQHQPYYNKTGLCFHCLSWTGYSNPNSLCHSCARDLKQCAYCRKPMQHS